MRVFRRSDRLSKSTIMKIASSILTLSLACGYCIPTFGQQLQTKNDAAHTQKIRKYVQRIKRWGSDEPVTVKMMDGTRVRGYITGTTDDSFIISDKKMGQATTVNYSQVKDVKEGVGREMKVGLLAGGAVLALIAICAISHGCRE